MVLGDEGRRSETTQPAVRATRRQVGAWALSLGLGFAAQARAQGVAALDPLALQARVADPRVRRFYAQRGWMAAWSEGEAQGFLTALDGAVRHGLDGPAFRPAPARDPVQREIGLTAAALVYGEALAHGLVDPSKLGGLFTLERQRIDVALGLSQALAGGRVAEWLETLAPRDPEYQALSAEYVRLSGQVATWDGGALPTGAAISLGGQDYRVPMIAQRLFDMGYLSGPPMASQTLSRPISEAVSRLQTDNGMQATGSVGNTTIALLNSGPADRARQLVLNLERRRWLRREAPATRIDVNTAAAFYTYYHNGAVDWTARAVVGRAKRATPSLQSTFNQMVVNPPWNVPAKIAREEIFPQGPGYLRRQNMYVTEGRVVQRPGPGSALGLVKFDLRNTYAIYLHDTPSKQFFDRAARHRSHGCVRVENAVEFARHLAELYGVADRFEAVLATGETGVVSMGADIPVRLLYHTAFLDEAGAVAYRPDANGWDAKLARALGLDAPRPPPAVQEITTDPAAHLGP